MKKLLFLAVLIAAVLAPLAASAEYVTFYDIIDDAKTLTGNSVDALWEKTADEAKAAVENLYGYKCGDAEDSIITCSQKHWTGDYQIKLFISEEGKLEMVDFILTSDSLRTLNYKKNGKSDVHQANDFYTRMEKEGLFAYVYNTEEWQMIPNILPNEETVPFTPALQCDEHSFIQFAYNVISETNPEFTFEFLYASDAYAAVHGRDDFPGAEQGQ